MRRREENNQDNRENTGKMSRLAKSVMAAGLAVGGATAFGDMSVFAAENEDGGDPGVTVDTNAQSDVEQHSVEIPTGAVSVSSEVTTTVSAPAPAAAEPVPATATPAPAPVATAPAATIPALVVAEPAASATESASATTVPAPIVSESTSTTTPETGNSVTTTTTEQNAGGAITVTKTETTYDPSTCTETKTETKTTTEIAPGGYDESTFGDKKTEETKKVTNPDGSSVTTTTNQYDGTDGSTTTETITETKTPGTISPTVISPSDGTKKDAVLVDENGNPVKDANGKNITDKVTDWEEKKTESTGETTTTTYVAITTSKAESANEEGVDLGLTEYYFTAIENGQPIRVPVSDAGVQLKAVPNGDGTFSVNYGGQVYTLAATAVTKKGTLPNGASVSGKDNAENDISVKVDDKKAEIEVTPNKDGSYTFSDVNGNLATLKFADGVVKTREGEPYYYLETVKENGTTEEVRLNGSGTFSADRNADGTYQVTIDGISYKVRAAAGQIQSETKNTISGTDENGTSGSVEVADNVDKIQVAWDTDKKKYKGTFQDKNGQTVTLFFDSATEETVSSYTFILVQDENGTKKVRVDPKNLPTPVWNETEKAYQITLDGTTYTVDSSSVSEKITIKGQELAGGTPEKVNVRKELDKAGKETGKYIGTFTGKDGKEFSLIFEENDVKHDGREQYYYIDTLDGKKEIPKDAGLEVVEDGGKFYVLVRKNGETGEPERFEVDKNNLTETVKEKKYYVIGSDGQKYEVSSGAALKVEERKGRYYVRFTPKEGSTPIEIAVDKIQTIAGSIYADDPNLKEISRIIGDFGVTAAIKIGDGHMDSNYRYGESNGRALGGSKSDYLPSGHTKGDTSYIGYVKEKVVNSGDSTKRLCINLRENQDLVTSQTANAAGVD